MRRVVTLAAVAVVVLTGCAQTAPPVPAALPSASSATAASALPSSTSSSAKPSSSAGSATPSSTIARPSVAPKTLTTFKLPATFGTYQASTATGTGEQQVVYANTNDAKDTLNVVVTALDVTMIASAYTSQTLKGPAICGTVS